MTTLERGRELFTRRGPEGQQQGCLWSIDGKEFDHAAGLWGPRPFTREQVHQALVAGNDVKLCAMGSLLLAGATAEYIREALGWDICSVNNAEDGYDAVVARYDAAIAREQVPVGTH